MTTTAQDLSHLNGSVANCFNRTSIAPTRAHLCKDNANARTFLEWFEGSVVCDKHGYPLVQYHGSRCDLGDTDFFPYSHFGNVDAANGFTGFNRHAPNTPAEDRGGVVYPVILNIKNPLGIPDISIHPIWNIIDHLNKWGILTDAETKWVNAAEDNQTKHPACDHPDHLAYIQSEYPNQLFAHYRLADCSEDFWKAERLTQALKQKGYDGIAYTNTHEYKGHTSWIALDPATQTMPATQVAAKGVPVTHSRNFKMMNTGVRNNGAVERYIDENIMLR
jgi:hypothetical protein